MLEPITNRDPGDETNWFSDLMGLCDHCFCFRWLARHYRNDKHGTPYGMCRSCERELNDAT